MDKPKGIQDLPPDVLRETALYLPYSDIEFYRKYPNFNQALTNDFWKKKLKIDFKNKNVVSEIESNFKKESNQPEAEYIKSEIDRLYKENRDSFQATDKYPEVKEAKLQHEKDNEEYLKCETKFKKQQSDYFDFKFKKENQLKEENNKEIEKLNQKLKTLNIVAPNPAIRFDTDTVLDRETIVKFLNKQIKKPKPETLVLLYYQNNLYAIIYYYHVGNQIRKYISTGGYIPHQIQNKFNYNIHAFNAEYETDFTGWSVQF